MRALLQRVSSASVEVEGREVGRVDNGLLVLLGVGPEDDEAVAEKLADKVRKLRVFEDDEGRMNRALADVGGGCLVVSQFTLYGDARGGNRPGFTGAAPPERADALYRRFVDALEARGVPVATGSFGQEMRVALVNRGPVTLWLDSDELFPRS
ncbi:MAG TPA: D-aminoacyl-tRNA deacylase [Trueperaceae bacterium]|nr:D-aminoacyl-tRNA deacylase [Trueperaceae bacterium]